MFFYTLMPNEVDGDAFETNTLQACNPHRDRFTKAVRHSNREGREETAVHRAELLDLTTKDFS